MHCTRFVFAFFVCFTSAAFAQHPQRISPRTPTPDITGPYLFVDSDDPSPLRPKYNFVDTAYQRSSWHRIYPGPSSIPSATPNAICWRSIGSDTTDNTFAGPIPIGFSFNFYGTNYDSVYLSSNGYIGFGNVVRASGGDGPAYSTYHCATLPDTLAPKAIAAFLMTDGEMVRTNQDSSRAFYRTSTTLDSFFITVYRYYHISGASAGNQIHQYYADVQLVLAKADSSITYHYRKIVSPGATVPEYNNSGYIWRAGCLTGLCSYASVIGVQNETQTAGTNYMCNGTFASLMNPLAYAGELHSGLSIRFKRWKNICRADSIIWPPPHYEISLGDSIIPIASFANVATIPESFYCYFRIRNMVAGIVVYQGKDSVMHLASGTSQRINFPKWRTSSQLDEDLGTMYVEAFASPYINVDHFVGDYWPSDDTLKQTMFVTKSLNNFSDYNNNFSSPTIIPGTVPDALKWMNINASVVDGDVFTYSPPPPRGKQGDLNNVQLNSPVIVLDRRDGNGLEYNRCAYGGSGPIGDGGVGDTIISFPIDLSSLKTSATKNAVLGFSYERAGKKTYPRWYDLGTVIGPERTVTDTGSLVYRAGDSLEIEFGDSSQRTNVTSWHEQWAQDGGKDFEFNRVYLPIDSQYFSNHFRFRVRLKAKNDFEPGNPSDDYDEWYVDNFVVTSPLRPEIEVSYARISPDWPWERVPASQSVAVPIECSIANNGGLTGGAFGLALTINATGAPPPTTNSGVYAKLMTIPSLTPARPTLITAPKWNARQAGPGQYTLSGFILPRGFDSESQNDSTFYTFAMLFDSSFTYDNGVNDIPAFFQVPGLGLKLPEPAPYGDPIGADSVGGGSGTIAVKFILYQRDTLLGTQLWFAGQNQNPDSIRIAVYKSLGSIPGDTIDGPCASFVTSRTGPWDNFSVYAFPCGPIVLDAGEYWLGVSQLSTTGFELGASTYKSSCDWIAYDPSINFKHKFVLNHTSMMNRFAFENSARSGNWQPFYFPNGIGKPAFSNYENKSAYPVQSTNCGKPYNYFYAQGSWIPLIRPYFGNRTFGPPVYDGDCPNPQPPTIYTSTLDFGTVHQCSGTAQHLVDSIRVWHSDNCPTPVNVHWQIAGPDGGDFSLDGIDSILLPRGASKYIVVHCRPSAQTTRHATLSILDNSFQPGRTDIPLSVTLDNVSTSAPPDTISINQATAGEKYCIDVPMPYFGVSSDSITSVAVYDHQSQITAAVASRLLQPGVSDTLHICFTASDTGTLSTELSISSRLCTMLKTYVLTANVTFTSLVGTLPTQPRTSTLSQNRPNPFSDETEILFTLAEGGRCKIVISDVLGHVQQILCDEYLPTGSHTRKFSSAGFSSGTYLCTMISSGGVIERVMEIEK